MYICFIALLKWELAEVAMAAAAVTKVLYAGKEDREESMRNSTWELPNN